MFVYVLCDGDCLHIYLPIYLSTYPSNQLSIYLCRDTAGQEKYRSLASMYYKGMHHAWGYPDEMSHLHSLYCVFFRSRMITRYLGAECAIIVFDITNRVRLHCVVKFPYYSSLFVIYPRSAGELRAGGAVLGARARPGVRPGHLGATMCCINIYMVYCI
jgi:hypothetical protein